MQSQPKDRSIAITDAALPLTALTKNGKHIIKLEERKSKLDADRDKIAKELADAKLQETIEMGQTEFVLAVEKLDLTAREVVVSTVLESLENDSRRAKIQAWVAAIQERKPLPDPVQQHNKPEVSPGVEPAPANQSEIPSAKPESSISNPAPTE